MTVYLVSVAAAVEVELGAVVEVQLILAACELAVELGVGDALALKVLGYEVFHWCRELGGCYHVVVGVANGGYHHAQKCCLKETVLFHVVIFIIVVIICFEFIVF